MTAQRWVGKQTSSIREHPVPFPVPSCEPFVCCHLCVIYETGGHCAFLLAAERTRMSQVSSWNQIEDGRACSLCRRDGCVIPQPWGGLGGLAVLRTVQEERVRISWIGSAVVFPEFVK